MGDMKERLCGELNSTRWQWSTSRQCWFQLQHFVSLTAKPVIMPFIIPPENYEGVSIQLLCTLLSGDNPITIYWLKDGISMGTDSVQGATISGVGPRTSMLVIPSVGKQHSGQYTCVASNPAGQANHSVTLTVLGISSHRFLLCRSSHFRCLYTHYHLQNPCTNCDGNCMKRDLESVL